MDGAGFLGSLLHRLHAGIPPATALPNATTRLRWIIAYLVWLSTLLLVLSAFAFGPWLLSMSLLATSALCGMAAAAIGAAIMAMRHHRFSMPAWAEWRGTWIAIVLAGAAIRVAWGALLPVTLSSDPYDYYTLAVQLATEGRYHSTVNVVGPSGQFAGLAAELLAWRPPGLPFLLAGWFLLFGASSWAIISFNLVIYVVSALALRAVALRLAGKASVAPVLLVFAVWPKHIGYTALPLTEGLSLLLLTLNVLLLDISFAGSRRAKVYAGLTYGAAALVRPSLVLLPVVWAGMLRMDVKSIRYQALVAGTADEASMKGALQSL